MRVTSIQLDINDEPKGRTVERVLGLLDRARDSDLILLPEIWPTGYFSFSRYANDAESIDGATFTAIRKKAREIKSHIFMGSFVERSGRNLYNASVLIDARGGVVGRYRKIHLFGYQSNERRLLTRGRAVTVLDTPWGRTGLCTCYDLRFPELFRRMVDRGAQFFLVTSAWPKARLEAWRLFNLARAHENLAWLLSCNCAGVNEGFKYAGHSMFVNPLGQVAAEAGEKGQLLTAEVDTKLAQSVRKDFSALNDRVFK